MPPDETGPQTNRHLPPSVISWLQQPPGEVVAVVATVDEDGSPRTALFGALGAPSPRELRLSCRRSHATFANIRRNGRVSLQLVAAPDMAVSVRGAARVVADAQALPGNVIISIAIEQVEDDRVPYAQIVGGIRYTMPDDVRDRLEALAPELVR
jgi:hypothetical protein